MKNKISYEAYCDKVFGCYLGVSIGGLFGSYYEGAKEIIDVRFDKSIIDRMLFNDDLDLQVLFFEAVKRFGKNFNSVHLAELFYERCPYAPGEYAVFKKNYARGIMPPYSGSYNNEFYADGMGCCIRGELWGCLFPEDPASAERYAYFDGSLDHGNESVYSEYFVSSLISHCFGHDDIHEILRLAADRLPESRFRSMVRDVLGWCEEEKRILEIRARIIRRYGHPDCTNVFQNLGFLVACLELHAGDFEELIEKTNSCGFDTDCTAGIAAAVWGTLHGGNEILRRYGIDDVKLVIDVDAPDYGGSVRNFAAEVARYGAAFSAEGNGFVTDFSGSLPETRSPVLYTLKQYSPELKTGERQTVVVHAAFPPGVGRGEFAFRSDELDLVSLKQMNTADGADIELTLAYRESGQIGMIRKGVLSCKGINGRENEFPIGFAVPVFYEVSEPFFDTSEHLRFRPGENYYGQFDDTPDDSLRFDRIRRYHLNYAVDFDQNPLDAGALSEGKAFPCEVRQAFTDKLRLSALTGYRGPCLLYVRRRVVSEKERECMLWCGCEGACEVWLNGEKVAENRDPAYFTYENLHKVNARLKAGENYLVFKVARITGSECFSCNLLDRGGVMEFPFHLTDLSQ